MATGNKKNPSKIAPATRVKAAVSVTQPVAPQWAIFVLLLITAFIYSKAVFNGFTDMDDDTYIPRNPFLRDASWNGIKAIFSSFYQSNYHPFTTLGFLAIFKWFGLNPLPYHLLNVVLHLVNTWLVYCFSLRLSKKNMTALVVATLFALHPLHVESVAWISELKDVMYTSFFLAALIAYLHYLDAPKKWNYIATLLLFLGALFSKSAAVTLPVLLLVIDVYRGRKIDPKSLIEKIPFFVLALVFGILNILAQKAGGPVLVLFSTYGAVDGLFLITSGVAAYILFLVAPFHLSAMHYFPVMPGGGVLPWQFYLSLPFLIGLVWLALRKNAYRKEILFGCTFFLVTISVMLQIVSVGNAYMAERYSYVAYTGFFYIFGQWLSDYAAGHKNAALGIFMIVAVVLGGITFDRIGAWKNSDTIFTDVIEKNPGTLDLNYIYMLRGDYKSRDFKNKSSLQDALQDYNTCLQMYTGFEFAFIAHVNRGHVYDVLGDIKDAIADYSAGIQQKPDFAEAYNSRGWDYFQLGNGGAALADFNKALALNPGFDLALNNRGWLYFNSGDTGSALADFDKAIQWNPGFEKPYFNRAMIKAGRKDFTGAITDFNTILKLDPQNNAAYYYRGMGRYSLNENAAACSDWKIAADMGNEAAADMLRQHCH